MNLYDGYPPKAILLCGDWEKAPSTDLSLETELRVLALGELATEGVVDEVIISGGLRGGKYNQTEAPAAADLLDDRYPGHGLRIKLDDNCYDTGSSAKSVRSMIDDLSEPRSLITSWSHMPRAEDRFSKVGHLVAPIIAEKVLLNSGNPELAARAQNYLHSMRYCLWRAKELGARGLLVVDRKGILSSKLAGGLRATRSGQSA